MKTHILRRRSAQVFTACLFAVSLILGATWALAQVATASGPEPPAVPQQDELPPQPGPAWRSDGERTFPRSALFDGRGMRDVKAATIDLGQPGLSFRYVQTFGETEVAYFEDTNHLNWPTGISTDGTNLWIAEGDGRRALKFANDGTFLMQIGQARFRYAVSDTDIVWLSDVAVDPDGSIWLVDAEASHVIKFDADGNYVSELGERWNRGSGNDQFNVPISIAFDSAGNMYVSDTGQWGGDANERIQIFDSEGNYLNTIGETGVPGSDNDHFDEPRHIAIYNNLLYVADVDNHRVQIFDVSDPASPAYVATLGVSGEAGSDDDHFDQPHGVAVDADYIYVADTSNDRIQIFDRTTRSYVATLGVGYCSDGNGEFCWPRDVAVGRAGHLYVSDSGNDRVQQFDSGWDYMRTYGTTGVPYLTDGRHYNSPRDVAVASDGSLYIAEHPGHRLIKVDATGAPQWIIGEPGVHGTDESHLKGPNGVALDNAGRVYVAESWGTTRVRIFNSDGTYYDTFGTGTGTGDYEFNNLYDIAIDENGNIYADDKGNHRIQVYDSSHTYVATLGETNVPGSDNAHFDHPRDVAVDSAGNIYVADRANHRVQVFDSNREYVRTIGVTGECGNDFGRLCNPTDVTVGEAGRIYVSDQWGGRIQVFGASGAYLTTIGGSSGTDTGQLHGAQGLAVDAEGNLYVADVENHRIQKFAPGVPGWKQVNINGFGDRRNSMIIGLAPFAGKLYAGTYNGNGAQLWRLSDGQWTAASTDGFGDVSNVGIEDLIEFDGQLYASTWNWDWSIGDSHGGEIWRSSNGTTWSRVASGGFGNTTNVHIAHLAVFNSQIYASTRSYTDTHGTEIWRSSTGGSGDWTQVVDNGFDGDAGNEAVYVFETFDGYLYAGTYNPTTGSEVWRTNDGTSWIRVNADGFGDAGNYSVTAFAIFNGYLYAAGGHVLGGGIQVWRCQVCDGSDWQKVVDNGFGNLDTWRSSDLEVVGDELYLVAGNLETGMEVWRTGDGTNWQQVGFGGFGDSNNYAPWADGSMIVFNGHLYISTRNSANGGEVWRKNIPGDLNGDDQVTIQDLTWMAGAWRRAGDYYFDLDGDSRLTVADIMREVVLGGGG